jgi:hypothetical protein
MSKHLLAITPIIYTGEELGHLRERIPPQSRKLLKNLPKYTINEEIQKIVEADFYLYWIEEGQDEYILFDLDTSDRFLQEEIENIGIGETGSIIEGSDEELLISIIKNHAYKNKSDNLLPTPEYVIMNIEYFGGGAPDYDWDVEYSIDGFMKKDLEIIKFGNNGK